MRHSIDCSCVSWLDMAAWHCPAALIASRHLGPGGVAVGRGNNFRGVADCRLPIALLAIRSSLFALLDKAGEPMCDIAEAPRLF
jgi:hypothetical protein